MINPCNAANIVVENRVTELWEKCWLACLERLALDPDDLQRTEQHRLAIKTWTTSQLIQFLRDTETTYWMTSADDRTLHARQWLALVIATQVELGQRLGVWPPDLEAAHEPSTALTVQNQTP